jgi:DNA-binding response OmpR family regulator
MKKILVVDDDEAILEAVALLLEDAGYSVDTTTKGEEARGKIKQFQPDIILLDMLLSGSDGRDICRSLKHDGIMKVIPVIMIAAHPHIGRESLQCGADDYLPKPFDINDLLSKVNQHIPS